jgi:phage-related tail fiber protein
MAIESKNLLVWVKAMSRGQALPLDASEVWESLEDAKTYAAGVADASSVAYVGQTLKVKNANSVDTYVISDAAGKLSKLAAATTVDDVYTKDEVNSIIAEYKHTITASASDDDIIVLEGTGGQNAVSYKATHADSGVTPGTYNSITVDAKGHITSGEQIDVYTKSESDALVYTISANAEDDDVVVLTGTSGENAVTYKATHAKTNNAGTYTKVTVNDYGHITGGDKPKNIADLGIEDVYTKDQLDAKFAEVSGKIPEIAYPVTSVNDKTGTVVLTASDVGADEAGTASELVGVHNKAADAHADIRALIAQISKKLEAFLDVDDATADQLSEVLTLIDNNKGTLESLTTTKVNVSDIVDNLTTESADKVLSAKQGKAIKDLIDALALVDQNIKAELAEHTHKIVANANDDNIVILEGTSGTDSVSYKATHAESGVAAGNYTKVTVNAYGHITSGSTPESITDLGITNVYTKSEIDSALSGYKHTITANAEDDDVVVLEGTAGDNAVSYKATHADSGVNAGEYTKVSVNTKGHITKGSKPTAIADLGITDVYTKSETDSIVSSYKHSITASASDDEVIILEGTGGDNSVTYSASHAKTNKAGTYSKVTVNEYGHIIEGSTPEAIADLGIKNVYTKKEVDAKVSEYKHAIAAGADDDDVIILESTSGENAVSYKATHAKTNKAGEYTKVTVNEYGHVTGGSSPEFIADLGIDDVYTKKEIDAAFENKTYDITANASHDDIVVLTGTKGANAVTYTASHANSGVAAGTYNSVTVDAKGHITAGANPTTLAGYGLSEDAYTKSEIDSYTSDLRKYTDDSIKIKEAITVNLGKDGSVGGYTTGNTIDKDTSIMDILKKLLQKAIPAVYKAPELKLSAVGDKAGNYEYGTNITAQVSASFTPNDAGAIQSIVILKDGTQIKTGTGSQLTSDSEAIQLTDTVSYTATADYAEGDIKNNNLGEASPDGHIQAGTITSSTVTFTPYRCGYFYGVLNTDSSTPLTSDIIRSGTKRNGAYKAETIAQEIKASSVANRKRIFVACPAANKGVTKVIMPSAQSADCTKNFVKQASTITVEGANGSTGIAYNVWVYEPALISDDQTFKVTLG